MGLPETFRCPGCGETYAPSAYTAHLAQRPAERASVFACFVADAEGERAGASRCSGALEILPLMERAEEERFGVVQRDCTEPVLACPCGGSFCAAHTFACTTCGRFACLRHRWSGKCPTCSRGGRAKQVRVEKYDPFSKQRSTFVRKYRRGGGVAPWDRLVRDDDPSSR